jgi:hypothetical protein
MVTLVPAQLLSVAYSIISVDMILKIYSHVTGPSGKPKLIMNMYNEDDEDPFSDIDVG